VRRGLRFIPVMLFSVLLGSCSDDPPVVPPVPVPEGIPFPATPDQVMENFRDAYETMDFGEIHGVLHPDHITILQQHTTDQYPSVGTTLDWNEEMHIDQRMFSGEPLTDPDGNFVPAVFGITFDKFEQQDAWTTSTEPLIPDDGDAEHPVQRALFNVIVVLDRGQTFSKLLVEGDIEFYVTSRDSLYNGAVRKFYTVRGQKDLTRSYAKPMENTSWGDVKALFR